MFLVVHCPGTRYSVFFSTSACAWFWIGVVVVDSFVVVAFDAMCHIVHAAVT